MRYETPEMDIIELDMVDIIQTSGTTTPTPTPGEDETPVIPASYNLNQTNVFQ